METSIRTIEVFFLLKRLLVLILEAVVGDELLICMRLKFY